MGTTTTLVLGALTASTGAAVAVEVSDSIPSTPWIVGGLLSLAAFVGWMVREDRKKHDAAMAKQDAMHAENRKAAADREERWQAREDERTTIHQTQVLTLQSIAQSLNKIDTQTTDLPRRVADEIEDRKP